MKGKPEIIERLNELLADGLTAINQYMVHSEMCDNWGSAKLHGAIEKRARDEITPLLAPMRSPSEKQFPISTFKSS